MARISGLLGWARRRARALPPIAWRDQRIAELSVRQRDTVRELKAAKTREVEVPSFRRYVYAERRLAARMREINRTDRGTAVTYKLRSYSFAQSWGVSLPEIYGIWDQVEDIAWDELPDTVVVKSKIGTYGHGVLPLKRVSGGWSVITDGRVLTEGEIVARFKEKQDKGTIEGPFVVEEFLGDAAEEILPIDVKFYAFYGEVGLIYLRSVDAHLGPGGKYRFLDLERRDLGPIYGGHDHDETIPIPDNLADLVRAAEQLSAAVPRAFVRVDLYGVAGRVVFGELTPRPGGPLIFPDDVDERLGQFWEDAHVRLLNDAIDGGDYALRYGPEPRELIVGGKPYAKLV
ncbi:MAG: hypothetical protein JWQ70_1232 [Aeromicrobium sp.]|nr:hypothetical protein [Aeromicrobium sp.]